MDRRRPRRARRAAAGAGAGAAAPAPAPAQPAQAPPYRLAGPLVDPRSPRVEEIFNSVWGSGNTNFLRDKDTIGRKFMPLPPGTPEIEGTFFEYKRVYNTGQDLPDLLMRALYGEHLNRVGDKRREVYHYLSRSSSRDGQFERLANELEGLMLKLKSKSAELTELTNMVVPIPAYFDSFPTLV